MMLSKLTIILFCLWMYLELKNNERKTEKITWLSAVCVVLNAVVLVLSMMWWTSVITGSPLAF
jgi:heme/copper-type cytochrome/quinol oxidase subunit 4